MKKVLVVFLVAISFTTGVFAENNDKYDIFIKMNNQKTFNGLVSYLKADYSQTEKLGLVFSMTEQKLKSALKKDNVNEAEKVIFFNLGNVKLVLSEEQYKKYLVIINLSVNNKKDTYIAGI